MFRRNKQSFSLLKVRHDVRGTRKLYMFIFWVKKKKGNKDTICKHWEITRRCMADNGFVKSSVSFCDIFWSTMSNFELTNTKTMANCCMLCDRSGEWLRTEVCSGKRGMKYNRDICKPLHLDCDLQFKYRWRTATELSRTQVPASHEQLNTS